ncbi:MAG TPA: hypothetical protein VLZ54_04895, partial [Arenibacter sp.]|nr:hypothetical protein [Arenibacter sp.]
MKFKFAIISFLVLLGCTKNNAPTLPLLYFVPQNSAVIIKINDKSAFSSELESSHLLKSLSSTAAYTAIINKISALQYFSTNAESILAFVESGKDNFEIIFIAENGEDFMQLEEAMDRKVEQISHANKGFDKYVIEGITFFTAVFQDKIVVGTSQILIENLMGNEKQWSADPVLNKLYDIANDQNSANIFINTDKGKSVLNPILADGANIHLSKFADWISLDLDTNKDHLRLNGISTVYDSVPKLVDLFKNTHALVNKTPDIAPESSNAILSYTFDRYRTFAANQAKYLNRRE